MLKHPSWGWIQRNSLYAAAKEKHLLFCVRSGRMFQSQLNAEFSIAPTHTKHSEVQIEKTVRCHLLGCSLMCTPPITHLESILFPRLDLTGCPQGFNWALCTAKGHPAEVWLSNAMPFCSESTGCIVFASHRVWAGQWLFEKQDKEKSIDSNSKGQSYR